MPELIARVQNLTVTVATPAKIIVNERTGTIVLGGDVKLSPVSVIHGSLSIQVATENLPVEGERLPGQRGPGKPIIVPETQLAATEGVGTIHALDQGANVQQLVDGLHAIGTTARDVVAILQAIKAEGGMQAELEVQ